MSAAFARLAREMLHYRLRLVWAMTFAFISALGIGLGLAAIVPILDIILGGEEQLSLVQLADRHNAGDSFFAIPEWVIGRLPADPFQGILLILGVLCLMTVLGAAASFLHMYFTQTVAAMTVARIRHLAFTRAVFMPLTRVVQRGPTEFVARIVRDAAELQKGFIALSSRAVTQVTKGLAALSVAIIVQPVLTLVAIPTAIIVAVVLRKLGKRIRRGTRGSLQAQESLLRIATEALQGLRAVKANTGEQAMSQQFELVNQDVVRHELRVRTARAASGPLMEMLAVFVIVALAAIAARFIILGQVEFKEFILAFAALGIAGASFRPLAGLVGEVQASAAPAARLCEILDEEPEADPPGRPNLARHHESITFEVRRLVYPEADLPALRDVTLRVGHGERIAIVGPNGSGKTTLVSLLPRLLVPSDGRVLVDDVDIMSVSLASLRGQIAVVTQETVLFRGSVVDNIAFGCPGATREQIVNAATRAHAHEFIDRIPGGYDADLAEQGASLSGGQRQRLSIARAILRDPSILILDEATSQIDAESEGHINAALAQFCAGRTALMIAHRLTTVLGADRIVVMDAGSIVDSGSHEELLERCPLYQRLAETQLSSTTE